jgi:hypothetical protein
MNTVEFESQVAQADTLPFRPEVRAQARFFLANNSAWW